MSQLDTTNYLIKNGYPKSDAELIASDPGLTPELLEIMVNARKYWINRKPEKNKSYPILASGESIEAQVAAKEIGLRIIAGVNVEEWEIVLYKNWIKYALRKFHDNDS
jgi:hypothetical protein